MVIFEKWQDRPKIITGSTVPGSVPGQLRVSSGSVPVSSGQFQSVPAPKTPEIALRNLLPGSVPVATTPTLYDIKRVKGEGRLLAPGLFSSSRDLRRLF